MTTIEVEVAGTKILAKMILKSGFTLVFGGEDFSPDAFLRGGGDLLEDGAKISRRGEPASDGRVHEHSELAFYDVHKGSYPLDPVSEAIWLLFSNRNEFFRLSRFPGIDWRTLNIFGDPASCNVALSAADRALLQIFDLAFSVCPMACSEIS